MTGKEAIERLTFIKDNARNYYLMDEDEEALGMAIEALEKQIPKKVNRYRFTEDVGCPYCGSNVNDEYCQYCGQRLDWGRRWNNDK